MPYANVRGVNLHYEVIGERGPWMMCSPGGRRDMEGVRYLAEKFAKAGFRVLIHDRRNCGLSDMSFDGSVSEYEVWADDLLALLKQLGATQTIDGSKEDALAAILAATGRGADYALDTTAVDAVVKQAIDCTGSFGIESVRDRTCDGVRCRLGAEFGVRRTPKPIGHGDDDPLLTLVEADCIRVLTRLALVLVQEAAN